MYISKIYLKNIRCFKELTLELTHGSTPLMWTTLLGDNSTGKTTLLRCIAIGLCDESSAAGLLRESEEGYIRHSEPDGKIEITLRDERGNRKGRITTIIDKKKANGFTFEKLTQETYPSNFPWGDIFICAYGIGRGISGTGDISGYTPISAVYNLFNYAEGLQNPELVLRRIESRKKEKGDNFNLDKISAILKLVLNLSDKAEINLGNDDIKIKDDKKFPQEISLRDVADGYKSTFQWITDLWGWAISYKDRSDNTDEIKGIVLVDALEEHLHPEWQKNIVDKLKKAFRNIQFITTTHSPIIARSLGGIASKKKTDNLVLLEVIENEVIKTKLDFLKGLDIDQILASQAFGYQLLLTEESKILGILSRLASKGNKRTRSEEEKYKAALNIASEYALTHSKSLFERELKKEINKKRNIEIKRLEKKLFEK